MIFLINSSSKIIIFPFIGLIILSACATMNEPLETASYSAEQRLRVAVLPFENLSSANAPIKNMWRSSTKQLKGLGLNVIEEEVLERFMEKYRMRYTGGIDWETAMAFREETGTEAVLITSLELYHDIPPPKIALTSRLVSTGDNLAISWTDSIGLAGIDSQGILGIGLIRDPQRLIQRALQRLTDSLMKYLEETERPRGDQRVKKAKKRFQPKVLYHSPVIDPGKRYTIAVIIFVNESDRKYAGEILALSFVKSLTELENIKVIEPGVIRQELLKLRIIMHDGISLAQSDLIFRRLNADLILTGKVIHYQDFKGYFGKPIVNFSTRLIERKSRRVVWASKSSNEGDEAVIFFDWGKINTAHKMTSEMVRGVVEKMVK